MDKTRTGRVRATVEAATLKRLNAALSSCHQPDFFTELYEEAKRQGVGPVSRRCDMQRGSLHAALGASANPTFGNLLAILGAMGLGLTIEPIEPSQCDNSVLRRRPTARRNKT